MKNIGCKGQEKLNRAGIMNAKQLREIGAEAAFIKVKQQSDPDCCIHFLYDLAGAIEDVHKSQLSKERKSALRTFYQQCL